MTHPETWLPHDGGPCPVSPETMPDVKYRNGHILKAAHAGSLDWSHTDGYGDILFYLPDPAAPTEEPESSDEAVYNASFSAYKSYRDAAQSDAEAHAYKRGYKQGWDDREGDFIAAVDRIAPASPVGVEKLPRDQSQPNFVLEPYESIGMAIAAAEVELLHLGKEGAAGDLKIALGQVGKLRQTALEALSASPSPTPQPPVHELTDAVERTKKWADWLTRPINYAQYIGDSAGCAEAEATQRQDAKSGADLKLILAHLEAPALSSRVEELEKVLDEAHERLAQIGDMAHHASTGPAVPDLYWDIRRIAYDAVAPAFDVPPSNGRAGG